MQPSFGNTLSIKQGEQGGVSILAQFLMFPQVISKSKGLFTGGREHLGILFSFFQAGLM